MSPRGTRNCDARITAGRRDKASQFWRAASIVETLADDESDLVDAYVTLLIHAGIAAADVICCTRLGYHAMGDNHAEAIAVLALVDSNLAGDLGTLLDMKTRSGYTHETSSVGNRKRAQRAADRLITAVTAI